ncbi:hypothetical protein FACS189491_11860 [Spirochaetia bacterium]|nr:hypothetical protein FACS189491_11860 [Spirochaetia bacterium]
MNIFIRMLKKIKWSILGIVNRIEGLIPFPRTFLVETFLGCNLSCPECACGGGLIDRWGGHVL